MNTNWSALNLEKNTAIRKTAFFICLGTQKIYVKTWGCSHNNSDSEYMAGQLAAYGYTITGQFCQTNHLWLGSFRYSLFVFLNIIYVKLEIIFNLC